MRIASLRWWRYRIPFRAPFQTAHGLLRQREGLLLRLETDEGLAGHGEVAPLPGFGGTTDAALRLLREAAPAFLGRTVKDPPIDRFPRAWAFRFERPGVAALHCGIEVAQLDLLAQQQACPLAALHRRLWPTTLPVNATIGGEAGLAAQRAAEAVAAGFQTIKLKVGTAPGVAAEEARVGAVRAAIGPGVRLRLDANGAWGPEQAVVTIRACERHGLEYVEQPVAAEDLAGMAHVRRNVAALIAADESANEQGRMEQLLAAGGADIVVIKPTTAGGMLAGDVLDDLARSAGAQVVVTTTLETGVGCAAVAHLAATLRPPFACGLATAGLLEADLLVTSLRLERGRLLLPEGPGLGVAVDWEQVGRYSVDQGRFGAAGP